jgi:hypothetical protein
VSQWHRGLRRAAGTRTASDVAKALFRGPSAAAAAADRDGFRAGEGRTVSCFLKGSGDPWPRRKRQGSLDLMPGEIAWRPYWSLHRQPIPITERIESLQVRDPGPAEWNLKQGGNIRGIQVPAFQVIVCKTDRGVLELSVPSTDVDLVITALRR